MNKPFKGIIRNWHHDGDVIVGVCEYHVDAEPLTLKARLNNGIVQGHEMHTSKVLGLVDHGTYAICETKNSVYVLTSPAR